MGSIGDCFDNALAESFFSSMQIELLDRQRWTTRQDLANAIFEWIEAFYNPVRRHSGLDYQDRRAQVSRKVYRCRRRQVR
jgi:putative transposase